MNRQILAFLLAFTLILSSCSTRQGAKDSSKMRENPKSGISFMRSEEFKTRFITRPYEFLQLSASVSLPDDISIPNELAITRPKEKLETYFSDYFITGTSDINTPLYFDGEELERESKTGLFGVLVPLEVGSNTFTFKQGDKKVTAEITRKEYGNPAPITEIPQGSMYPAKIGIGTAGKTFEVSCIAPASSSVSADFMGSKTVLEPAGSAEDGIPTRYKGTITVKGNFKSGSTEKTQQVKYSLEYKGVKKDYSSTGFMYISGPNCMPVAEITHYIGIIYHDTDIPDSFKEFAKRGARDYVTGSTNSHLELLSGGFISADVAEIIEGEVSIASTVKEISVKSGENGEAYRFEGVTPTVYDTELTDGQFSITIYNTASGAEISTGESLLFSSAENESKDNTAKYTFTLDGKKELWGYKVEINSESLELSFKYRPRLNADRKLPLKGIKIVIDPGHGGNEPGSVGVAGTQGPLEKDVNLWTSMAIADILEQNGAEVILTRKKDVSVELNERLEIFENSDADLFLSIHHNSVLENRNANKIFGVETYYHTPFSHRLASTMLDELAAVLERDSIKYEEGYYRVTIMEYAPSALLELGYMSCAFEYEKFFDTEQVCIAANAVAKGVIEALKQD